MSSQARIFADMTKEDALHVLKGLQREYELCWGLHKQHPADALSRAYSHSKRQGDGHRSMYIEALRIGITALEAEV